MILHYPFYDPKSDESGYSYRVSTDSIMEFIEETFSIKQLRDAIKKIKSAPNYLLNNDLHDIHDRIDAVELIAKNMSIFHGSDVIRQMIKYFEDDARAEFEQDKMESEPIEECLTEDLDVDDDPDLDFDKEKDYKKEYIDKYGDTITYANQQVECKILDVTYDPEFGYDVKIENPLYIASDEDDKEGFDDDVRYIWIGDPNFTEDDPDEIDFIPTSGVEANAVFEAEREAENSDDDVDPDEYLNDKW